MLKWIGRIIMVGILIVIILGAVAYCDIKKGAPPKIEDAPYAVQAYYEEKGLKFPTRYYYAENIEIIEGKAVLNNYWTYDGEKFNKQIGEKSVSPPFTIVRRKE